MAINVHNVITSSISAPLKAPSDPEKERTSRRARYRADPEKRQRYCHSTEHASRSAKRVKVTQRYVVPLQPPSHIKMDYLHAIRLIIGYE